MSNRTKVVIAVGAVVVLALAAGVWWWLSDDNPPEVTLEAATEGVTEGTGVTTVPGADATSTTAAPDGIAGEWVVDVDTGEFDFTSATGSFVGFRVREELAGIGATEAVGRTGGVTGAITLGGDGGTTLTDASFEVDMAAITTDEPRRDNRVHEALATDVFPTATFELTEPIELGNGAGGGDAVTVGAPGELTVHGVSRQVTFPIEAQLVDDTIVVVGSLEVVFSDYDVQVPSAPIVVSAEDRGVVEFQLLFRRA